MINKITTKEQSRNFIVSQNLNRVPEIFIENNDYQSATMFIQQNVADLYVVRDADHSSGKYYFVHTIDECIRYMSTFFGKIILAVSINSYKNKILLGAVEITDETVFICATENQLLEHRTMYSGAEYNFKTTIYDKQLDTIPMFDFLYKYLYEHKLFGYTVEFTIYDRPVGINNEVIIINEVRNY